MSDSATGELLDARHIGYLLGLTHPQDIRRWCDRWGLDPVDKRGPHGRMLYRMSEFKEAVARSAWGA